MTDHRHIQPPNPISPAPPRVSVVVPVYNALPFLDDCVKSILTSTYTDFELILIDDGSTDGSGEKCDSYADRRIRVIHTPNNGVSAARNTGIDAAYGEYIAFVDADDMVAPAMLGRLVELCDSTDTNAAVVGVSMTGNLAQQGSTATVVDGHVAAERLLRQKDYLYNPIPGGKIFRRRLFDTRRFRPGRFEDLDIMPRLFVDAWGVTFDTAPLYYYRQHDGAFSHTISAARLDALAVTADLEAWAKALSPSLYKAARDRRFSAAFNVFNFIARHDTDGTYADTARECMTIIRERRGQVLCSPKARLKNRLGALASYLGSKTIEFLARH